MITMEDPGSGHRVHRVHRGDRDPRRAVSAAQVSAGERWASLSLSFLDLLFRSTYRRTADVCRQRAEVKSHVVNLLPIEPIDEHVHEVHVW
jgi:hypothetical protein